MAITPTVVAAPRTATGSAAPIVEARALAKTYDTGAVRVQALRGVGLSLERGEMVAIMGPSGCGKTTLLNCLSGLDGIDSGEVVIEGTPLSAMSDRERTDYRARRMGFVFQFYNLMPVLTAVENVELPLLVARVAGREARERAVGAGAGGVAERARRMPDEPPPGTPVITIARSLVTTRRSLMGGQATGDLTRRTPDRGAGGGSPSAADLPHATTSRSGADRPHRPHARRPSRRGATTGEGGGMLRSHAA
jgi:putative ABC transport system ATP-binding protein